MFPSLSLLCLVFFQLSVSRASPSTPVATNPVVTTITAPTVSNSLSTGQTVVDSSSTYENIQTITTTDDEGNSITTTTDNGPVTTVVQVTQNVVATIAVTGYVTFVSTVGESTVYAADSTTSDAPSAAVTSGSSSVLPAPADSTQTTTYVSLGITYAPVTTKSTKTETASTILSIASSSSSSSTSPEGFPANAPSPAKSSGMSMGAKAAIGTAAVVVSIFLAILIFWLDRLRRQRKAIAEQYPNGPSGDEAGIFGFFSPVVGKPYEREDKGEKNAQAVEEGKMVEGPAPVVRELSDSNLTPPTVDAPQPYRRPIPQRKPYSPRSPISPIPPVSDSIPEFGYTQPQGDVPDSPTGEPSDSFRKGFPRPSGNGIYRFPSHHATKSSGNVTALPEFFENG